MIFDLSAQSLLYHFCAGLVIIATHGWFLALAARLLGDSGPGHDGRMTLNPMVHVDPVGTLMLVLTQFGWVRPVGLEPGSLFARKAGPALVALIALGLTLILAVLLWQLRPLAFGVLTGGSVGVAVIGLIETTAHMSVRFVVLNLLPVLPLSLGHALIGPLPRLGHWLNRCRLAIGAGLALIVLFWLEGPLRNSSQMLARVLFGQ